MPPGVVFFFASAEIVVIVKIRNRRQGARDRSPEPVQTEGEMDRISKKILQELEAMQEQTGRMLRNMSLGRMLPVQGGAWQPAADIYEADDRITVFFDLAGVEPDSLEVVAGDHQVRVSGRRQLPSRGSIACVHQLEIELGAFERTVSLPAAIDVDGTVSTYHNGILTITLPKRQKKGRITIPVRAE